MDESRIVINGVELTEGQSMTLRVAVTNLHSQMASDPDRLGTDDNGRTLTKGYRERSAEVLSLIHGTLIR
jgi:hypothetical protein